MREAYIEAGVVGIVGGLLVFSFLLALGVGKKPLPKPYLVTCYSGGQIIFERDGILEGNVLDCGDRRYHLPENCLMEELK